MSEEDKARLKIIRERIGKAKIYEFYVAVLSSTDWAATVSTGRDTPDQRFRFTRGKLFSEAAIGDARV